MDGKDQWRLSQSTPKQVRACNMKKRFPSRKNAAAVARVIGGTMCAYKCPLCRRWHVGHDKYADLG